MKLNIGVNGDTLFEVTGNMIEIYNDGILYDHFNDQEVADLVDFLTAFQNRPKQKYFLWKGSNGTIISHLTTEDDLPSITIGGGGKREKFETISAPFVKDRFGNFKEY